MTKQSYRSKRALEAQSALQNPEIFSDRQVEVLQLVALEMSNKEICEKLGIAKPTLSRHINQAKERQSGKALPSMASRKASKMEEVFELHSAGKTISEISARTGYSYETVHRYHNDLGLTPRKERKIGLTALEASRVIWVTERNVIIRRMNRGLSVSQMAALDNCSRDFILHQMHNHEIDIPEDERWVMNPQTQAKSTWYPKNRETRKQTAVNRAYDASIVRTYKPGV